MMPNESTTGRVFLLWLNEAVVGVFATSDQARAEAASLMREYGGPWHEVTASRWTSDEIARVSIEPRQVH